MNERYLGHAMRRRLFAQTGGGHHFVHGTRAESQDEPHVVLIGQQFVLGREQDRAQVLVLRHKVLVLLFICIIEN